MLLIRGGSEHLRCTSAQPDALVHHYSTPDCTAPVPDLLPPPVTLLIAQPATILVVQTLRSAVPGLQLGFL